jgi:hypothetical protein
MVAIVAPSGANANVRIGASPTPRTRRAGLAPLDGPEMGNQGRTTSARRRKPIRPRLQKGSRGIPIRERLGRSFVAPGIGSKMVASRPGGEPLGYPWRHGRKGIDGSMGWVS